jgi:hypothetical protein
MPISRYGIAHLYLILSQTGVAAAARWAQQQIPLLAICFHRHTVMRTAEILLYHNRGQRKFLVAVPRPAMVGGCQGSGTRQANKTQHFHRVPLHDVISFGCLAFTKKAIS